MLRHLADVGPSELEDLQTELALSSKELKSLHSPLERGGALGDLVCAGVRAAVVAPEREVSRWFLVAVVLGRRPRGRARRRRRLVRLDGHLANAAEG